MSLDRKEGLVSLAGRKSASEVLAALLAVPVSTKDIVGGKVPLKR